MTWLAPQLNKRIKLLKAIQDPVDFGGMERSYLPITSLWAGMKPVKGGQYIRGVQIDKETTHIFTIRQSGVLSLGRQFATGFSSGYDSIADQAPVKVEYFIFLDYGSQITTAFSNAFWLDFTKINIYEGRLFRIRTVENHKEQHEYFIMECNEIEEQNTGYKI